MFMCVPTGQTFAKRVPDVLASFEGRSAVRLPDMAGWRTLCGLKIEINLLRTVGSPDRSGCTVQQFEYQE